MVDPSQLEEIDWYRNPETGKFLARDPTTGDTFPLPLEAVSVGEQLDVPVYSDDANAPSNTHYFNDSDGQLKFKDADGTVHSGGSSGGGVSNPLSEDLDANGHAITNAGSLNTNSAVNALTGRPTWTDELFDRDGEIADRHVLKVPDDFSTVQDAADAIPHLPNGCVTLSIADGSWGEDVVIPEMSAGEDPTGAEEWRFLTIVGNPDTQSNVDDLSIVVNGDDGAVPVFVRGLTLDRNAPSVNEDTPLAFLGGGSHTINNCNLSGVSNGSGLTAYHSNLVVGNNVDFDSGVFDYAYDAKKQSWIVESRGATITGSVNAYRYAVTCGKVTYNQGTSLSGSSGIARVGGDFQGFAHNVDTGAIHTTTSSIPDHGGKRTTETISGGSVTPSSKFFRIEGEGGTDDTLETINGGSSGIEITISGAVGHNVTLADGVGNLRLQSSTDYTLPNAQSTIKFQFEGSEWLETARSEN